MIHGILNVYKEKGCTSHDVVARLRKITKQKKIGHTGTLDPDAAGVLPVCLGKATKLCEFLTDKDKTYETVLLLGKETDTQDISGKVLIEQKTEDLTEKEIKEAVLSFIGGYDQVPPMYSALKVNGRKLYELAREGKVIERKARPVSIYDIHISSVDNPRVRMSVTCSKGTYIRTLCHDIGRKLGCGGCMEELIRSRVSRFLLEESMTLEEIEKRVREGTLKERVLPVDAMFEDCPKAVVNAAGESMARNGNVLPEDVVDLYGGISDCQNIRIYDREDHFIALYRRKERETGYRLVKMFFPEI